MLIVYHPKNIIPTKKPIKNPNDNSAIDAEETDVLAVAVTGKSSNSLGVLIVERVEVLSIPYTASPFCLIGITICFVFGSTATVCKVMFPVRMD